MPTLNWSRIGYRPIPSNLVAYQSVVLVFLENLAAQLFLLLRDVHRLTLLARPRPERLSLDCLVVVPVLGSRRVFESKVRVEGLDVDVGLLNRQGIIVPLDQTVKKQKQHSRHEKNVFEASPLVLQGL